MLVQRGISRTREFEADVGAGNLTQNPRELVSALQKLERSAQIIPMEGNPSFEPLLIINAFSRGGLANLFSTHPSTAEHVERLEEQARTLSQAAYTA